VQFNVINVYKSTNKFERYIIKNICELTNLIPRFDFIIYNIIIETLLIKIIIKTT